MHNHTCQNPVLHTIVAGDTLWALSQRFHTSVDEILALNPGTEIYNLQIGATLLICPNSHSGGSQITPPIGTVPPVMPPIGVIPPVLPPIGTVPPVGVTPPVSCLPPVEVLRELVSCILSWVRDHFGEDHAKRILEGINANAGNGYSGIEII